MHDSRPCFAIDVLRTYTDTARLESLTNMIIIDIIAPQRIR